MRITIIGSTGQVGSDLCLRLKGDIARPSHADLPLDPGTDFGVYLDSARPDTVINCAAYNFVDQAEAEPEAAFNTNAWGVRNLANACESRGIWLVHFSTDYVFGLDENRQTPYTEDDAPGPVSVYGLSKLAGEYLVQALCHNHLVIRTCGLFGHKASKKGNFIETMLRLAREGKPLRVVDDQVCTPTSTADLAAATVALLEKGARGLFHYTNSGSTTWHSLARTIFDLKNMPVDVRAVTSREYARPARRPAYSVLSCDRFVSLGLPGPRPWQEALAQYLAVKRSDDS
jgi:dTDP-4-dehydrorhamnose reductase